MGGPLKEIGETDDDAPLGKDANIPKSPKSGHRSLLSPIASPRRAAKRKSTVAVAERLMQEGEYRVFPLSKYQGDGWEPFLPKNPLEGSNFFAIAMDFEARRRRLDVARNTSLLHADDADDWKNIASKRTARRLAKEGIAADATGMGAVKKGVVLVDDNEVQYTEPPWYEPTQDQIKKFLRAEAKRVWTQDGRLDALVQRILKETKQIDEGEDEGYEQFEEDDYQTALRVLAKLQSRPKVLCCAISLTGSGSSQFVTTDRRLRNRSWVVFRRAMAESLGLTEVEIAIVSAVSTTAGPGTMAETVDVDFRICTPHAELADVLAELIEECVEDGSLGRSLTMSNLQSLTALRKGPAIFEFPGGYDSTHRLFGEQAGDLRRQIAEWEYHLSKKKHKAHRQRTETTQAEADTHVYDDHHEGGSSESASTPTPGRKKRFKLTSSETLEEVSVPMDLPPPPPHGFALQPRPQTVDRVQSYAQLQASHSRDGIQRPKSETAVHKEEGRATAEDRWGVGLRPSDVQPNAKLAEYFSSRAIKKAAPQRGNVTSKTQALRKEVDEAKAANRVKMKEEREREEKYRQDLISRTRSISGWGDSKEISAMVPVMPSIEHNIQQARNKVLARTAAGPAPVQTRIQTTVHPAATPVAVAIEPAPEEHAEEKSGLGALSLPRHVSEAVGMAELTLDEVMECSEEELMQVTGLGQLDCWRLKKQLLQHGHKAMSREDEMLELARKAREDRARLQQVVSRVDAGSRDATSQSRQRETEDRQAQMDEEQRSLAERAGKERARWRSIKSSIDTGSKILPPRGVSEQRSGLSAFSELSEHSGLGMAQGGAAEDEGRGFEAGESAFKGASQRSLSVEGQGGRGAPGAKPKGSLKAVLQAARAQQKQASAAAAAAAALEPGSSLSVQSMTTPSRTHSFRSSRSPSRQSSMRSRRHAKPHTDTTEGVDDNSDASSAGGYSPFPQTDHEEPSAESQEALVKASQNPLSMHGITSRTNSVDVDASPVTASDATSTRSSLRQRKTGSKPAAVRTHGPKITLPGGWSNLLNDVLPDTSKAIPTMKKKKGKRRSRKRGGSSSDSDEDSDLGSVVVRGPCLCCKGTRRLYLADLPEHLQEILPAIGKLEVDCPLCCPLPKLDIEPTQTAHKKTVIRPWSAKQHLPEPGKGLVVFDDRHGDDTGNSGKASQKRSVAGVAIDGKGVSVVVVFDDGWLEEFELLTGARVHSVQVEVVTGIFSVCRYRRSLYLGMDSCIKEVSMPPAATTSRTFKGQSGHILCLSPTGDDKLVSGSRDQTTFIWDLATGKVLQSTISLQSELPNTLQHLARGLPPHSQAYAFRHHTGPVACCSATRGVVITGGWDGLLCVVSFNSYRERWVDERAALLLKDKKTELKRRSKEVSDEMATFTSRQGKRTKAKLEGEIASIEGTLSALNNALVAAEARLKSASQRCRKFLCEASRDVGRVTSLAFTALENKTYGLFAGYSDGKVRQWDVNNGTVAHVFLTWVPMSVTSVCLGIGRVYCGYANGAIKVWDLTKLSPETIRTQRNDLDLLGHQDGVAFLRLCDNLLFSCSDDKAMRTWDLLQCDPEMTLPLKAPHPAIERTMSTRHARLEEVDGAVMRVLSIPEHASSSNAEAEEEDSESSEMESEPEPEAPPELQALSASLPFDPAVYTENKAEQVELLTELLEIGQAVETLSDSLVDQTIKARAYILRNPTKPARQPNPPRLTSDP